MLQRNSSTKRITINIDYFDDDALPPEAKYVASIQEPEYKGIVESGSSVGDCVKEIGISLQCDGIIS